MMFATGMENMEVGREMSHWEITCASSEGCRQGFIREFGDVEEVASRRRLILEACSERPVRSRSEIFSFVSATSGDSFSTTAVAGTRNIPL